MDPQEIERTLRAEGFHEVYVWEDKPGMTYGDHAHLTKTAHVILEGGMTLTVDGKTTILKPGDRADVPANAVHSATIGPEGCRYVIGEE